MPDLKMPRMTNVWARVVDGDEGEWFTRVVIESTKPYEYRVTGGQERIVLETTSAALNMPEGVTEVNDGLLREISVNKTGSAAVIELILDFPAEHRVNIINGFPYRIEILLDRSVLINMFRDKIILIDPGHGGNDPGARGAIGLCEKNVVLGIAKNLEKILERVKAKAVLTRDTDEDVDLSKRYKLPEESGAELYLAIHTHASTDRSEEGIGVLYATTNEDSKIIAGFVQDGMVKKLKAFNRGIREHAPLDGVRTVPAIQVEVLAITNQVEEVFLRGLTILEKAAEGIFIGLAKYYAGRDE